MSLQAISPLEHPISKKDEAIAYLCGANNTWSKDSSLIIPRPPPTDQIPLISIKINTHRGKHFYVFEGIPKLSDDTLWLAAEINLPENDSRAFSADIFSLMLQFMVSQMKKCLEQYRPARIHPNLYMRKPTNKLYVLFAVRMA